MILISSLVSEINAEPSHWYEDVDVYSISDLVGVSVDRFENCLNMYSRKIVFVFIANSNEILYIYNYW